MNGSFFILLKTSNYYEADAYMRRFDPISSWEQCNP